MTTNREYLSESREVVLDWPYKDCVLEGGQTKEDQKRSEIFWNQTLAADEIDRLLEPKVLTNFEKYTKDGEQAVSTVSIDDNLIIKGNNLLALHSLKQQYGGKVKLIYIDPPYNNGNDSFGYNDSFNHSTWLTFMKNRLEVARELLHDDGVIFVQCDDNEQAYLQLLLNDIFKNNYLNTVIVKAKSSSGASGGGEDKKLKKNTEYIHIYYKNSFSLFKEIHIKKRLDKYIDNLKEDEKSFAYKSVLVNQGDSEYVDSIKDGRGEEIKIYKHKNYEIKSISKISKEEKIDEYKVYKKYIDLVFTTENAQTSIRDRVFKAVGNDGCLYSAEYLPISGRNKGDLTKLMFIGNKKRLISFLKNTCEIKNKEIFKQLKIGSLWDDMSWSSVFNEGCVTFTGGKKPEKLIQRILEMATKTGDIFLDYHLGSGTTCAVAHKMGRRYIGIEQMDYIQDIACKRLKKVISGEQGGISKTVNWQGGGEFIYCELAEHNAKIITAIEQATTSEQLQKLWRQIQNSDFISYQVKPQSINANITEFSALNIDEQKQLLIALLDKNQLYVNYADIDDLDYQISSEDKKLNHQFYGKPSW